MVLSNRSLYARFRTAVVGASFVMGTLAAVAVYLLAHTHLMESGRASVAALTSAIEDTAAVGAYANDLVLLREITDGLTRHPQVARVDVLGADGESLLAPTPGVAAAALPTALPAALLAYAAAPPTFDHALRSPFDKSESIGRLRIWMNLDQLAAEARHQSLILVLALVALLGSVLVLFNLLALRMLSRPMHRLAVRLTQMTPGTAERIELDPAHLHDEVGVVSDAANRLLTLQQQAMDRERALRVEIESMEARYRGIFDSTSAGLFILSSEGRLVSGNPALARLLGHAGGLIDSAGQADFPRTAFRQPVRLLEMIDSARRSGQLMSADVELACHDGSSLWAHCLVSVRRESSAGGGQIEGVLFDVSARKEVESENQHRAEHDALTGLKSRAFIEASLDQRVTAASLDHGAVTLMFIDLDGFKDVNDRWGHAAGDAVLVEAAQRLRRQFKRKSDIVGRLGGDELVVMLEGMEATDEVVRELACELIDSFRPPFSLPGGQQVKVGASVGVASYPQHATDSTTLLRAADAAMYAVKQSGKGGFVIASTEVVEGEASAVPPRPRPAADVRVERPTTDPLTGLPDRRLLADRLKAALARTRRSGQYCAVLCLDIDQFRNVNVARGTQAGDELLLEVARRFSGTLRGDDTVARSGSDEFVLVVHSHSADADRAASGGVALARKLLAAIAEPMQLSDGVCTVQASAGLSLLGPQTEDPMEVLRGAQLALRRAKAETRGGVAVFENEMLLGLQNRLQLEHDLRLAIGTEQLQLHVQLQVDPQGRPSGGEALLRWTHPLRGPIPPSEFIPLAEATGSIIELGRWVVEEGCRLLARMAQSVPGLPLSVNISPAQFQHPDFVAQVREAITRSGAPADRLILEITENLLIANIDTVIDRMNELVALGVRFSIDDFGAGFSSLSYLRRLPLYEIKIDRSFVCGLPSDSASAGIVQSLLALGSHLKLNVVAEGVETPEQAGFLNHYGCAVQQGWLHGRPAPFSQWLDRLGVDAATADADARQAALSSIV